jgi:tetratricopeptide (TPR) repeat protein
MLALQNLESNPVEQREASEIVISICKPLPDELRSQEWVTLWVTAHYELGLALSRIGAKEESILAYDEVSKAQAKDIAPEQVWRIVWALRAKAYIMQDVGRKEEALPVFDEAIAAGQGSRGTRSLEAVARALADKGAVLRDLKKYDEALAVFGELLSRFGDSQNAAIQSMLGYASVARADLLEFSGKLEAANVERESLVSKFLNAGVPRVAVWVAWALSDKGKALHKLGRNEEALECFDKAILYCSTELPSQPVTGWVLRAKAQLMADQGDTDAALEIYRDVVNRFGDSVNPDLQFHVALALENQAEILEKSSRGDDARAAYESIIRRFPAPTDEHLTAVVARASAKIEALKQQPT